MSILGYILGAVFFALWLYILHVLDRAKVPAWRFLFGSAGLFIFMMVYLRPLLTEPLARLVAAIAGIFGNVTGIFTSYFKYGVIFIESVAGAITLQIDFECSGILEIMAFLSLLIFFRVYSVYERIIVGIIGTISLILFNVIRIIVISCIIYACGTDAFYMAHTIIGRLIFYALSVVLYFIVFTKPQIIRQRVGGFRYGDSAKSS